MPGSAPPPRCALALRAGVLALAAGTACPSPADAGEGERGWFDAIVDFLTRSEGAPVEVPLRKPDPAQPPAAKTDATEANALAGEPAPAPLPPSSAQRPERPEAVALPHVHRAVEALVADIDAVREATGAGDAPPVPEPLEDRAPVHVYVKTLEVRTKVTDVQRRLGVPPGEAGRLPLEAVGAGDLLAAVERVHGELGRVAAHVGVERAGVPAALAPATTPSLVHQALAHASVRLDALRGGPFGPADVRRHAAVALGEVERIARVLGVAADREPPPSGGTKSPVEVAQQLLRAAYKVVNVQRALHMDASRVPRLSLERATSPGNYDLVNLLLAELARIRWHLGMDEAPPEPPPEPPPGQGPDDAFAVAQRIVADLDRLAEAASQ